MPERVVFHAGDIVRDAQTGRLWIVDEVSHVLGSTPVRRIVWPRGYGAGAPRSTGRSIWIPTKKLALVEPGTDVSGNERNLTPTDPRGPKD